jgi:hypothetical protein
MEGEAENDGEGAQARLKVVGGDCVDVFEKVWSASYLYVQQRRDSIEVPICRYFEAETGEPEFARHRLHLIRSFV